MQTATPSPDTGFGWFLQEPHPKPRSNPCHAGFPGKFPGLPGLPGLPEAVARTAGPERDFSTGLEVMPLPRTQSKSCRYLSQSATSNLDTWCPNCPLAKECEFF